MCTRSCLHSTASQTSNSASPRLPRHKYSSRRNPASSSRARPPPAPSSTAPASHAILNATATAIIFKVLWKEPEDDRAVAACCHGGTPDNSDRTSQAGQQRLNNKLRQAWLALEPSGDWRPEPTAITIPSAPAWSDEGGGEGAALGQADRAAAAQVRHGDRPLVHQRAGLVAAGVPLVAGDRVGLILQVHRQRRGRRDRKSTRLNSSHSQIS